MRTQKPKRSLSFLLCVASLCGLSSGLAAQDAGETPLGDIARSLRKKAAASESVIDNDNFSKVVDDAESKRAAGMKPMFAFDPGTVARRLSSPDITCSLSFTGKNSSSSDSLLLEDLPREELGKLDGPAAIEGDSLQVSMHNGSGWEVHEVVIGLTIVKRSEVTETAAHMGQPQLVPALAEQFSAAPDSSAKQPDVTLLLHVKGSAAPSTTATFRTALNFALFPDQDWHWAIVRAKGVPPQNPSAEITAAQPEAAHQGLAGLKQAVLPGAAGGSAVLSPAASVPVGPTR